MDSRRNYDKRRSKIERRREYGFALYKSICYIKDIAELMQCFMQKDVQNPVFSNRIQYLKKIERGKSIMCEVMENYAKEYAKEYVKEYAAKEKDEDIRAALKKGFSIDTICEMMRVTKERVEKIQKAL